MKVLTVSLLLKKEKRNQWIFLKQVMLERVSIIQILLYNLYKFMSHKKTTEMLLFIMLLKSINYIDCYVNLLTCCNKI